MRAWWCLCLALLFSPSAKSARSEPPTKLTTQELAEWIDARLAEEYTKLGKQPAAIVDDATFLRRTATDLLGRVPSVAELRDFLDETGPYKRQESVEKFLNDERRPTRYAQRSAENLGRVWRRMMVPASSPGAAMATQLEPWLARQFEANTPYDQFARKLLLVAPSNNGPRFGLQPQPAAPADPDAAAGAFQQAVGVMPENLATAYVRVFLGVRLGCAQCHDHPMADWKRKDFWGVAALFTPIAAGDTPQPAPQLKPENATETYVAQFLWDQAPLKEVPAGKTPRELLADWMVSPRNPNFAATAVNRTWQYLCGRGLAGSVDDLDRVPPEERKMLDDLAQLFIQAEFDLRWLITGICKSRVYQQVVTSDEGEDGLVGRPLKTLLPEQVFDSLEEALHLPIAALDKGPRFTGERAQFVARLNESAPDSPTDFKAGIPQALMLMNGKLTADATSLEKSRTLRAIVEAPFLSLEEQLDTMFLAALSRKATAKEREHLLKLVNEEQAEEERKQVFAEIYWGLLNSPEFVLSR